MPRRLIACPEPPPAAERQTAAPVTQQSFAISVITPMFGGGVEPGISDPVTPIRATAIRGHLRFWWRATRGAKFRSTDELRREEGRIWGTISQPSPVKAFVQLTRLGSLADQSAGYPTYAVFPFLENPRESRPAQKPRIGVEFSLTLECPAAIQKEIRAALWAWTNFGGLGARTRRGCGALYCRAFAPASVATLSQWILGAVQDYELSHAPGPVPWPTLQAAPLVSASVTTPIQAWAAAVDLMRQFRQGERVGRDPGYANRPGRSRWPEPDSLRAITGAAEDRHRASITVTRPAFPRAGLGLPIVFWFQDRAEKANNCLLCPVDPIRHQFATHMSSPVILRPLAVGDPTSALAMVLALNTPGPAGLRFQKLLNAPQFTAQNIYGSDLSAYPNSPMRGRSAGGSALEAFLIFAQQQLARRSP